MSKLSIFGLVFIFLEFALLFKLAGVFGGWTVLFWLVLMVVVGVNLIRFSFSRFRAMLEQRRTSVGVWELNMLLAGVLLIFPGVITDCLAVFLLVFPKIRYFLYTKLSHSPMAFNGRFKQFFSNQEQERGFEEQQTYHYDAQSQYGPHGQPQPKDQAKSDIQKAKEYFQSKRPVVDVDFEPVPDNKDSKEAKAAKDSDSKQDDSTK